MNAKYHTENSLEYVSKFWPIIIWEDKKYVNIS